MDDHDRELIQRAGLVPGGGAGDGFSRLAFAELIVGLKDTIKAELAVANELSNKIRRLNQSLVHGSLGALGGLSVRRVAAGRDSMIAAISAFVRTLAVPETEPLG